MCWHDAARIKTAILVPESGVENVSPLVSSGSSPELKGAAGWGRLNKKKKAYPPDKAVGRADWEVALNLNFEERVNLENRTDSNRRFPVSGIALLQPAPCR